MKFSTKTSYHEQYPSRGFWGSGTELPPIYQTIGGSGSIGTGGAESPMSEGASMNSGSGEAAGAAPVAGGSGVA